MGSTTLLPWNPTQANQETDAQYAADSTRIGGATDPQVFPSLLGNKAFNQWSNYLYALFTAFANKGFSTSDANMTALTAQCANFLTRADIKGGQSVAFSPNPVFNCGSYSQFSITLTGNVTALTIPGASSFQLITLIFVQDGVGGRTVAFPSNLLSPGTPAPAPGATSVQTFMQMLDGYLHPVTPMVVS